ncbi:MAG: molybdopterin-dependent oxidoreductase [Acidimicrobiales bacterium]
MTPPSRPPTGRELARGALDGACSAGLAMGLAFLLDLVAGAPTLPQVVAGGITRLLPGPAFGFLIDHLQERARPLFVVGLVAAVVVVGAGLGAALARWTLVAEATVPTGGPRRRHRRAARVLAPTAVLVAVTLPLVAAGPGLTAGNVAVVVGDWLAVAVLTDLSLGLSLSRPVWEGRRSSLSPEPRWTRRGLLESAGAGVGLATVAALSARVAGAAPPTIPVPGAPLSTPSGRIAGPTTTGPAAITPASTAPKATAPKATTPAEPTPAPGPAMATPGQPAPAVFGDLSGITPTADFYVVSKNLLSTPRLSPSSWSLRVEGAHPFTLSYDQLRALPHVEQVQTLECISNLLGGPLMGTGRWRGVPLSRLLGRAGVPPGTVEVRFACADGYTESLPVSVAMQPSTLVADQLNGAPLPAVHGYPARILVTGRYGMKDPKWLTSIGPSPTPVRGYWEQRGWNKPAVVLTTSRVDYPRRGAALRPGGLVPVRGVAYAGDRGIGAVELSLDGGRHWQAATLQPPPSPYSWVVWTFPWRPAPGSHELVARARDGTGALQPARRTGTYPDGAGGWERVPVTVA